MTRRPARIDSFRATSTWDGGYTNNLFELDYDKNRSGDLEERKVQYAFYVWTTDLNNTDKKIDGFESDIKYLWTEVYQLIGFFSVFQGVLFQGLTQLTAQLSCRFYKIPVSLSVLASLATLVGVHVKLSKVREYRKDFFRYKLRSKVLETRIRLCRNSSSNGQLKSIDFKGIEAKAILAADELELDYEKQLGKAHRRRVYVLALLAVFSGQFAWIFKVIMCHTYN